MKCFAVVSILLVFATFASAQTPASPAPTGIVVGSGNFFSPIVRDLDKAVAFYRDGLGFNVQGQPNDAATNPELRNMFGLPDSRPWFDADSATRPRTGRSHCSDR